ncbi:AI-2E family transporter [Marinobacter nanhaiticus D15-8W]|uniref:AI-2E family transporter n=1 Tax=Marinobacter nanhaiticus D15-8W TaxID=626887 RepID=N6VYH8_9GAMM|nr:AI-2E family transporter [Marinobacter nanhaiticus]ENO12929.1 AI-2E family transporter [Marinobacter nanhaiticus D15-8W]BES70281.1 AI-2E family transporter [Marinobacter nanhaiticus D15-8W]
MDSLILNSLKIIGLVTATVLLLLGFWFYSDFFLLLFGGMLWGLALSGVAGFTSRHAHVPYRLAVVLSLLSSLAVVALIIWQFGPKVLSGVQQLQQLLPEILQELKSQVHQHTFLSEAFRLSEQQSRALLTAENFSRIAGMFSSTLGAITALLFIMVTGTYFAATPGLYKSGVIQLVVPRRRDVAERLLDELGHALRWWLLGRLLSLSVVGILTWIGLFALGIPSAAALAFVAAALSFIPNIGPILSVIPAVLVGWSVSPSMALWVVLLYLAIQTLESYLITPLIQQRNLAIAPALLLAVQLLMSLMFGVLGLLLATPLTVVALVLVRLLYIRKVLGDSIRLP